MCFLSGHSVPKRNNYLELANKVFQDERIGGCYGEVIALPDGSFSEKMFNGLGYIKSKLICHTILYSIIVQFVILIIKDLS